MHWFLGDEELVQAAGEIIRGLLHSPHLGGDVVSHSISWVAGTVVNTTVARSSTFDVTAKRPLLTTSCLPRKASPISSFFSHLVHLLLFVHQRLITLNLFVN
jgi:hypothetical protein